MAVAFISKEMSKMPQVLAKDELERPAGEGVHGKSGAKTMRTQDEHDDDPEPEVNVGAEIETVNYPVDDDVDESQSGSDVTNPIGRGGPKPPADGTEKEERETDADDTI
jgi:hypothetical protein